jgi:hypothetical protein
MILGFLFVLAELVFYAAGAVNYYSVLGLARNADKVEQINERYYPLSNNTEGDKKGLQELSEKIPSR